MLIRCGTSRHWLQRSANVDGKLRMIWHGAIPVMQPKKLTHSMTVKFASGRKRTSAGPRARALKTLDVFRVLPVPSRGLTRAPFNLDEPLTPSSPPSSKALHFATRSRHGSR
jgi:hypothetical protein